MLLAAAHSCNVTRNAKVVCARLISSLGENDTNLRFRDTLFYRARADTAETTLHALKDMRNGMRGVRRGNALRVVLLKNVRFT